MSIKDKPLKKCHSDKRVTIDKLHNNIIDDYKKQKENYNKKYDKESDSNKKSILKNKIKECNEYINEYYLNNGELLFDYYNDDFKTSTNDVSNTDNSILNFFNDNKKIEDKDNVKKDDTIIKYMSNIDDTYLNNNLDDIDDKINICKNCGNNNLTYKTLESEVFCNKCGYTEKVLFENDKTSYKETPKEISYFAYKRINHFNEWITQFQGKETTQIPNKIYNNIIEEIKKDVHLDIKNITNAQVRIILKKLKYNKYYENIPNIINIITNRQAPIITREYEEKLRSMFKEIQVPFMNNCPENRKNFLSYSYVLHKFCELLELDHLLHHFSLLKSREKLQQQDIIWKKICNDLEWEYIPSI
jgi:ribosomal protein S27AE